MATYTSTLEESIYLSTYLLIDLRGNGHPPDYLGGNATCTHLFKRGWSSIYLSKEGWPPILSIYLSREGWPPNYQSRVGWTHPLILKEGIYLPTHLPILEEVANFTHLFRKGVATYIFILQGRITTYPFILLCLFIYGRMAIYLHI